jgi:antitoxin component YwqK of YwqJK toxin-antitoxin module
MFCRLRPEWNLAYGFLLFLGACTGPAGPETEPREHRDDYGNVIRYHTLQGTDIREGLLERRNPEGVIIEMAHYRNDTLDGQRVLFYDSGDTMVVEHYVQGLFDGPFRAYHERGTAKTIGQYVQNNIIGQWRSFYADGTLREEVTFENNAEHGPFKEYHPNGRLKAEGFYRDGDNEDGELRLYDEQGRLLRIMQCQLGRCKTIKPQ